MVRVLQITPEAAGVGGGVRATARAIATELAGAAGIESTFVSGGELLASGRLPERPEHARVVLHYVGYGYARRGCPWELVSGVERWRRGGSLRRLVTVFHELYASGPPWTSAFWLEPVQRRLGRRLARASDALWTSSRLYRGILKRWSGSDRVVCFPVPSAVGEPREVLAPGERTPRMVVFGTPGLRERAYRDHWTALVAACGALGVQEVLDVGAPAQVPPRVGGVAVESTGPLPDAEVSRLLSGALAGFLVYPPDLLEKSSVFAAYAAHGVVPVCAWHEPRPGALEAGRHFLPAGGSAAGADAAAGAIASRAHAWYREHGVARQAAALAELLA
jgi:hypothetical protein